MATFFSLATGDVKKFTLNLIAYVIYFFGIKIAKKGFEEEKIKLLFNEKKSLLFSDEEIEKLWRILELGI